MANAKTLVEAFDVIVDGTDNFPARYLVNDACVLYGKPNAWGSIFRFEGQAAVFAAPGGPCYRCLHPGAAAGGLVPSCAEAGVLGVLPGIIGTIQATEALKLILGIGDPLDRPLPRLRRAEDALPRAEAAEGSRLPGLRHPSDDHQRCANTRRTCDARDGRACRRSDRARSEGADRRAAARR